MLEKIAINLNEKAKIGKIDPLIGRKDEVIQTIEILNRRFKNNPVLIGEAGVGKTAIAEALAFKIVHGDIHEKLKNKIIYSLDVATLVSGTSYRGQFEQKLQKIIKELEQNENIILFIDEIHLLVGAGAAGGSMDAGNIFKPVLARGDFQVIGATTLDEYRMIESDPALERRFESVTIKEPTEDETFLILKGLRSKYEEFHHVLFTDEVLKSCITLSMKYIQNRFLPDKAIDLLDLLGSKTNLKNTDGDKAKLLKKIHFFEVLRDKTKELCQYDQFYSYEKYVKELYDELKQFKTTATLNDLIEIVERKTGIPISTLQDSERDKWLHLEDSLSKHIIGQKTAVTKVSQAVKRSRAGLKPKNRPIASFLFNGPTGVGKTELAKVLTREVFGNTNQLIRLDMSEYMEKHSISKIIGSPPGYVGYSEAGGLTEKIRRNPYSLLLLDEIEKAHPEVQHLFLQLLDEGHLTDNHGRSVDFKHTIIIATTNAKEKINHFFKPEFLNRFDDIIAFEPLGHRELHQIIDLLLSELKSSLKDQGVSLLISNDVKEFVLNKGFQIEFGARPLRRAISEHIENPIADFLLEEQDISDIFVKLDNGKPICVKYSLDYAH
jgi:ATP-dependent Clp protease ATP-binding subunit ClpE